jgi:serine phosphatase RsbU (regulator of sigma subunit)/anti-sigma regulatory factor (Ser/Thr protein kinase)
VSDDGEITARALLAPEPTAASRARWFIKDTLRSWQLSDVKDLSGGGSLVDDAVLLVSELVANAVQHAGTELEVSCRLSAGALEVAVMDRHPARTLPEPPFVGDLSAPGGLAESERGRGLMLPSALASSWGVTYTGSAKTVWFRLRLPTADADPNGDVLVPGADGVPAPGADGASGRGADGASGRGADSVRESQRDIGNLHFDELVRHTVEAARDAVGADAAYALVADEDGELRVRGAVGVAVPDALTMPPGTMLLSGGGMARSQMSVPFLVDGRVTGVLGVGSASIGTFREADETRLQHVADRVAMSLERLRLSELERVRRGRVAFLAEASELLSSTLDQRQAIALTAQLIVPRLASWCAVFLTDDAKALRPAYVWHEDESRIDVLSRLLDEIAPPPLSDGTSGIPGVAGIPGFPGIGVTRTAQSWSLAVPAGAGAEAARMASDSAWCFPLTARGRGLGAVVIGRPRADRRWQDPPPRESLELAEDLTRRAALALDNARLYERQRMTSQALQHSLLPPELPEIPRTELAAEYEAAGEANEVGGDFYDVFAVGERRWRFAIGDVSGTGPEAAAVTGLARHTLRILAAEGHPITEVVRRLNGLINREGARGRFITLLHGEITVPPAGRLSGSRGSGPVSLPLLLRGSAAGAGSGPASGAGSGPASGAGSGPASAGEKPRPAAEPQMLLGVEPDCSFDSQRVQLFPGDLLLCVTDGVTERRDESGRLLDDDDGLARLLAGCRELSAWAVASRVRRAVSEFGPELSSDDMAVLVVRASDAAPLAG